MIFITKYLAKGRIVSTMQSQGRGGVFPFPEKCGSPGMGVLGGVWQKRRFLHF
jgi:hypothetical protein